MVLRAAFAEFERMRETKPLYIQPNLSRISICPLSGALPAANCPMVNELFVKGSEPSSTCSSLHSERERGDTEPIAEAAGDQRDPLKPLSITIPTPGLKLARDPRIPDHLEALRFQIATGEAFDFFEWILDGSVIARTDGQTLSHLWSLITGRHSLKVRGRLKNSGLELYSEEVTFTVSAGSQL
jgi:penicillin-binding protein 1C